MNIFQLMGLNSMGIDIYGIHGYFVRVDGWSTGPQILGHHSLVSETRYMNT